MKSALYNISVRLHAQNAARGQRSHHGCLVRKLATNNSTVLEAVYVANTYFRQTDPDDIMLYGSTTMPFAAGEYLTVQTVIYYHNNNTGAVNLTASLSYLDIEAITL